MNNILELDNNPQVRKFREKIVHFDLKYWWVWPGVIGTIILSFEEIMKQFGVNIEIYWPVYVIVICQVIVLFIAFFFRKKSLNKYDLSEEEKDFFRKNLGFYSFFVPGSGQIMAGLKNRGLIILFFFLITGAVALWLISLEKAHPALPIILGIILLLANVKDADNCAKKVFI